MLKNQRFFKGVTITKLKDGKNRHNKLINNQSFTYLKGVK